MSWITKIFVSSSKYNLERRRIIKQLLHHDFPVVQSRLGSIKIDLTSQSNGEGATGTVVPRNSNLLSSPCTFKKCVTDEREGARHKHEGQTCAKNVSCLMNHRWFQLRGAVTSFAIGLELQDGMTNCILSNFTALNCCITWFFFSARNHVWKSCLIRAQSNGFILLGLLRDPVQWCAIYYCELCLV